MYVFPTSMDDRLMDVSCRRAALSPLLQRCVPFATSRTPEYEWKWKSLDRRSLSVSFAWLGDSDFKFLQLDAFFFFFSFLCERGFLAGSFRSHVRRGCPIICWSFSSVFLDGSTAQLLLLLLAAHYNFPSMCG